MLAPGYSMAWSAIWTPSEDNSSAEKEILQHYLSLMLRSCSASPSRYSPIGPRSPSLMYVLMYAKHPRPFAWGCFHCFTVPPMAEGRLTKAVMMKHLNLSWRWYEWVIGGFKGRLRIGE